MKLRLHHHADGTRIAYREAGAGPKLAILHSAGLTHREWEPIVSELSDRFRLVLPDLPLHGDSEDHPRHPYTLEWLTEVIASFCDEVLGPRPLVAGHEMGAEILLRGVTSGLLTPSRMVLMPNRLHGAMPNRRALRAWRMAARTTRVPGMDRAVAHLASRAVRPAFGERLSASGNSAARDLVRHAFADMGGNGNRARSWGRLSRAWPLHAQEHLLDAYGRIEVPVLLLWADADARHPLDLAEVAFERLGDAQLRVLSDTGFLMAYDDPVGLARELAAFCG